MSSCQELQSKINQLKDLKSQFEQIYTTLPSGSNREPAKREVLAQANEKRDEIELMIEEIEKLCYWKAIELGTYKNIEELRKAIEARGDKIREWDGDILKNVELSWRKKEIFLAILTVKELTGKDEATLKEIYDAIAKNPDISLCPAEVGPQLRLQYSDQPTGEELCIAMEPINSEEHRLRFYFDVDHISDNLELAGMIYRNSLVYRDTVRFVVAVSEKNKLKHSI